MKKKFYRMFAVLALASSIALSSGCMLVALGAVGAAAAGTVAYEDGELVASLGNKYDSVVTATNLAIGQLQFSIPDEKKDALSDTFSTHSAKNDTIKITITNVSENLTKVQIRIGTFGDEQLSQTILDKIKANL